MSEEKINYKKLGLDKWCHDCRFKHEKVCWDCDCGDLWEEEG